MSTQPRLELPTVTLVCVDTRTPGLAVDALRQCRRHVRFGEAVLFTSAEALPVVPPGIRAVALNIESVAAYSHFMLRDLLRHVATEHVLVVQWDGYVLDPAQWDPAFLRYDYIGALLHDEPPGRAVGNGGFSLRSRRLLQALQDPAVAVGHPEDLCICQVNRERLESVHSIRFAPAPLAARFAYERVPPDGPTFGFHGLFNMHRVLAPEALMELLRGLPDELSRGLDAHDLCAALIKANRLDAAAVILEKRRRLGMNDRRTLRLRLRFTVARWRRRPVPLARAA